MVPKVPKTGRSFIGAWNYYAHDKRTEQEQKQGAAKTSRERVAWTHSENMAGMEASKAAVYLMRETAKLNKRCQQPVYAFSLAWHPEEAPSQEQMIEAGNAALKVLGMDGHQALFFAHHDTDHPHVHILVNRVHPETLKAKNNFRDFKRLSEWARDYEREHGKIYCAAREARALANAKEKAPRYADHTILEAWSRSEDGTGFQAALEAKGWKLGLGDHKDRFMALAPSGRPLDILREINKSRAKGQKLKFADIERRFADLKPENLKRLADLQAARREAAKEEYKRLKAFQRQGEREARREFYAAANAERWRIETLHRIMQEKHGEQQRIHQKQADHRREEAEQDIRETYRTDEKIQALKSAQQRLKEKGTFWGKLTGQNQRQQKAAAQEIEDLRRTITEGKQLAEQHRQHIERLIRQDADALALRQRQEREALPPIPEAPERTREPEQRQDMTRQRQRDPPGHEQGR
ncbi:MAG: relaxase/mobilization nuclease domain-containing protein [Methylobacter sp.]